MMRVVNMTVRPIWEAAIVVLLMTTVLVAGAAQEVPIENQEETQAGRDPKKTKKKHTKRKAKHADRDVISQLRDGELSAAQLAQALNLGAGRIGSTIDRPTSSGVAIIKELQKMPPEKLTGEIIPAIENELISSLKEDFEGSTAVSGRLLNLINALSALGTDARPSLQKAYGYDPMIDLFITRKLGPDTETVRVKELLQNSVQDEYWLSYYVAALTKPGR